MRAIKKTYNQKELGILKILEGVFDPEVPVLSILDLGIIRNINWVEEDKIAEITITPTYSGCPAMDVIAMNIRFVLLREGYTSIKINMELSPAWTTDWMTASGKDKLKAFGIAPPNYSSVGKNTSELFPEPKPVQCPLCNSMKTTMISEFGSTSCKSLYKCDDCKEPFDHFKCH
ncbi:MAG: 1,2-phenylacetyl-CoA epoxidase subunit PaaD [Flavitalea sp.]